MSYKELKVSQKAEKASLASSTDVTNAQFKELNKDKFRLALSSEKFLTIFSLLFVFGTFSGKIKKFIKWSLRSDITVPETTFFGRPFVQILSISEKLLTVTLVALCICCM
jgi:hypothetical protein